MIEFEKTKIVFNHQVGKGGRQVDVMRVVAVLTEKNAMAFGEGVRWSLYDRNGVIRPGFGDMHLTHEFLDASFHFSVTGLKAEAVLNGVTAHKFQVMMQGDGKKKPKRLAVKFDITRSVNPKGAEGLMFQEYIGACT